VKLVFYYPNTVSADDQLVNDEVNKILPKAINATVKLNVVDWGAYTEKMNMIIAAQEPYDICFTASWANPPTQRILNGAYSQIDPLFQYAPKLKELVPAYLWGITKYRGKIYTIPNYQFNSMSVAYYIQKRFIDKYGFNINSVPKEAGFETLKALEPLLEKIKNGEPGIYPLRQANYGFGLDPENPNGGVPVGLSGGLVAINPTTGKAFNYLTTAWDKATKAKMHELYLKGYIRKDIASVTEDQADMDNNKYAFTAGAYYPGAEDTFSSKVEVVAVPLMKGIISARAGTDTMLAISRTSKNPDKAIMFIQELWTNSNLKNTIIFGIEGTHYKKIADNQIEFIKDGKYQQNAAKWEMGTVFNSYLTSSEKPGIYEKLLAMEKVAESSKLSGFTFDPTSVKTELAQLVAVEQEINSLSKGQLDPESYMPKMLDKVEKAGVQKVINEVQKQYDEWLKTK
jgi:putative aldouronate transport system substrate-binding protein